MELTDKVLINNLCAWPIYFKRLNGVGDVCIPANVKNFAALDVQEVQMQIQSGNTLFTGTNGLMKGDHARLFIVDEAQRKALFGLEDGEDNIVVLTPEAVRDLLAIKSKEKFNERLRELVSTDAEKKMVVSVAKEVGGDEAPAWKMEAIKALEQTIEL